MRDLNGNVKQFYMCRRVLEPVNVPVFEEVQVSPDGGGGVKHQRAAALLISGVRQVWVGVLRWVLWLWFRRRLRFWCCCGRLCSAA